MKRLAIFGAGGHAKVVADIAQESGWSDICFFDDDWPNITMNGCSSVKGDANSLLAQLDQFEGVVVAIGNARIRLNKQNLLRASGADVVTLIHPRASVSRYAVLGVGTVVMPGAVIMADASIGDACIVNTAATVDHDCRLAEGVHIGPGAHLSGDVVVGERSWIGLGALVRQGICVGRDVMVGAGAVVVRSVEDGHIIIGNPARQMEGIKSA